MRISDWSSDVCSSDLLAARVPAAVVHDAKAGQREVRRHLAARPARQQLEGGFGAVVGKAPELARLHLLHQLVHAGVLGIERDAACVLDMIEGVMPEAAWLSDGETLTYQIGRAHV